jgi:PGF-pre-PGF domain-containing protein
MRHTDKIIHGMLVLVFVIACLPSVIALGLGTFETEFSYTPEQVSSIKYFIIKDADESITVNLDFEGSLAQYAKFRMNHYWYSTRSDQQTNTLQREFDLTNVSSATLSYYTKYKIEFAWDYGYVDISTNNGSSWTTLKSYTGSISDWTTETFNISAYTGNVVLIRFRYVTDMNYAEYGWLIDDIAIPEIGFFDDVESGSNNWTSVGWLYNVIHVDQTGNAIPVYIDFTIPDSYVHNGSVQKVIATQVPGVEQGFNPSQSAVSRIVVIFPPVVKIPLPPPEEGGGGGSGQSQHYWYDEGQIDYVIDDILPDIARTLVIGREDSLVRAVELTLSEAVDEAAVRVTPLDELPQSIKQDLPRVYSYFEISTSGFYSSMIKNAVVNIAVEKSWIDEQGAMPEDIVVTRFSMGRWTDMETDLVSEDRKFYFFDATLPGFSVFAVRIREPIPEPEVLVPTETPKPDLAEMKKMTFVGNVSDIGVKDKTNITQDAAEKVVEAVIQQPEKRVRYSNILLLASMLICILGVAAILTLRFHKRKRE